MDKQTVRARGIDFAVFSTPPVAGKPPLVAINGGMIFDHGMLWPALSPLAATRQVILYDLRGRGESSAAPNPADASIEDDAREWEGVYRDAICRAKGPVPSEQCKSSGPAA